ncbi:spore germination protein [Ferdinandcohnia quinoae]|uniref:Spore germination protein n=1 Tax=Fredinandcohnia quinoae TaxID=2918902 RepID=A0AAW5DY72_9BACI|nr:spore germination protein [Fredinandcohnia sp. SECRCQ15]MCH1625590.1 spore germination protein [Fredinandcohnia sp. SECRCQ15]
MGNWFKKEADKPKLVEEINNIFKKSADFKCVLNAEAQRPFWLCYQRTMVKADNLHKYLLPYLLNFRVNSINELKAIIPIDNIIITDKLDEIEDRINDGHVMVQYHKSDMKCALIPLDNKETRSIPAPELEFSVIGPKEAFVESLDTNINLIRKRLPTSNLKVKILTVGKVTNTKVAVLYMDGIVDKANVQTILQRIDDVEYDQIIDSSFIAQMIDDNVNSPFPLSLQTERPDRAVSVLVEGKVVMLSSGSPQAFISPTTLVEFFSSFDDYFFNWYIASFVRLLRLFAVIFSILVTPLYVAVLTYHHELIPRDLLATLVTSRREVPLPPILEALFLELTIELLREAGARLPTKVGQTIGIVGGIVIGTASVEAGLTSNVLLIIVALAALASFTTPVYIMGNTIRLIRFPFLLFAQLWGLLGIVFCFCLMLTHLIRLTSLGRPYLEPIYPPRLRDLKDAFVRLPFSRLSKRPVFLRTNNTERFSEKNATAKRDIDE